MPGAWLNCYLKKRHLFWVIEKKRYSIVKPPKDENAHY